MSAILSRLPSVGASFLLHCMGFLTLLLVQQAFPAIQKELQLESIFSDLTDEMPQEDMTRELDLQTVPAETLNVVAGGTVSSNIGGSAQPGATVVNVGKAAVMKEGSVRPMMGELALPTDALIGQELGEGEIAGEVGAIVEGYGAAMGIVTQEIIRIMRHDKVTVIWLFDESASLEDDRKEIRENYLRIYDELGIAAQQDKTIKRGGRSHR